MKLQDKFFNAFFYLFLIGIIISISIIFTILFYYSINYLDKNSARDIYNIEKRYVDININSINILLTNVLLKVQVGLQEQITFYQNIASDLTNITKLKNSINNYIYNVKYLIDNNMENSKNVEYLSFWFVNKNKTSFDNTDKDKLSNLYQQVAIFSQMTQSLYSVYFSMDDILKSIYFLSEDTSVFIGYPYIYYYNSKTINDFYNFVGNPSWCTDEEGNLIDYYKFQCRDSFNSMIRAKDGTFDLNYNDQIDKKIFISPPYFQLGNVTSDKIFSLCIKFNDSLTNKNAYMCSDIEYKNLFDSFDSFNDRLIGYFSIVSVGQSNAFYFPQMSSYGIGKTLGEYIFRWDKDYYLEEKLDFFEVIHKILTSNYYKKLNIHNLELEPMNIFEDIYIDDSNGESQYFYLNKVKYYYNIYPIILQYNKQYEHVASIVYFYNKKLYYQHMLNYQNGSYNKLIFQLILFVFYGAVLLYLIYLGFKILAKFIVVPIKNVKYMLEGINVGGEYRLKFLSNLQKKQEDNLEKLNKINLFLLQKNNSEKYKQRKITNLNVEEKNINFNTKPTIKDGQDIKNIELKTIKDINEKTKNKNGSIHINKTIKKMNSAFTKTIKEDENLLNISTEENEDNNYMNLEINGEIIDPNINYEKQYDLDNGMIEKELNFYDFDEELLQYRPVEIDRLVQSLLNLKGALLLTSSDNEVKHIIDYSSSEYVFNNFKNKEGMRICQSNIGNLQSQLLKYDKAIYHLASSLENVELKKFLSNTLDDEFDGNNTLLHKIKINYRKDINEKEVNVLVKKQQNHKRSKNFSQKTIGVLINSRYNKLIYIYFKFFSYIQKSNFNYEKLNGWFMHTNFHTINYYHKILIQYIYLCFASNDLVKIGESILDYIEFLIKFKLKTSKDTKYILYINNKDIPEIKEKQEQKKKYFDKIIDWFNLFDCYAKQIYENSALGNFKDVLDAYSHNLASNRNEFNSGNQSALLFQVHLQRCDFLKGKFALVCKDYHDAIKYLINAAKKNRIVVDGLIKKRALKHIAKIAEKVKKTIIIKNYQNLNFNKTFYRMNYTSKNLHVSKSMNNLNISEEKNVTNDEEKKDIKFIDAIKNIINVINNDIDECNEKQLKDIIILIDCNYSDKITIDSFIDVTKTILKNYLTSKDRLGVFLLLTEYRIICPMSCKCDIDILNFSKDLDDYSEKIFKKDKLESSLGNEIFQEKLEVNDSGTYKNSAGGSSNNLSNDIFDENKEDMNTYKMIIEDTIKSLNYCINYLKMKEISTNEKYFIYFNTNIKKFIDYLIEIDEYDNFKNLSYESNHNKKRIDLKKDKKINFLLVGKVDNEDNNNEFYKKILLQYFGPKSEMIPYDNMKKIKTILSANSIINDNIIFPNEIYS